MKKFLSLTWILNPIKFILFTLSIFAILFTVAKACKLPLDFSSNGLHNFILLYSDYSLLFAATFIVINVQLVLKQQAITEKDNEKKWNVEENKGSLIQCQYYLNEIQNGIKDLIDTGINQGMPVEWMLSEVNRKVLKESYPFSYTTFSKMEKDTFHKSVIFLFKLDAFSAIFLHGVADIEIGEKVIGYLFCKQVGMFIGIIAYFRTDQELYKNTLQLYNLWRSKLSIENINAVWVSQFP